MKATHVVLVCVAVLLAGGLSADETKKKDAMEMDPAMRDAMKQGAPGEHHKALEPFVGRFTITSRAWMNPDEKPMESKGSAEHAWVLGGRFVKMEVRGDLGGQEFEGVGYLGYDNIRGEYVSVWLDNMNTGIIRATGEFDPETGTCTEKGTFSCPMTGEKDMPFRGEWKIVDKDTISYAMYQPGADGKEVKGVEVRYDRVK